MLLHLKSIRVIPSIRGISNHCKKYFARKLIHFILIERKYYFQLVPIFVLSVVFIFFNSFNSRNYHTLIQHSLIITLYTLCEIHVTSLKTEREFLLKISLFILYKDKQRFLRYVNFSLRNTIILFLSIKYTLTSLDTLYNSKLFL